MVTFRHIELKGSESGQVRPIHIFIHHDGALGDMLLSLPCFGVIRTPASHIHIAGRRDVVHFLKEAGIANEVSSADSRFYSSLYTETLDLQMKSFLTGFDKAFVFTGNAGSLLVRNIRTVIPDARMILTIPPEAGNEHVAEFRLEQCEDSADAVRGKISICIPDEERIWAADLLRSEGHTAGQILISVHPGSGGKKKCWPLANYAALLRRFMNDSCIFCIVFTGPAEDAETLQVMEQFVRSNSRIVHVHVASLINVAALLEQSDLYVGNDSGISHLAGLMKCRGLVLFGPTDPRLWRPAGESLDVVHFDDRNQSAVEEEILRLLQRNGFRVTA